MHQHGFQLYRVDIPADIHHGILAIGKYGAEHSNQIILICLPERGGIGDMYQ